MREILRVHVWVGGRVQGVFFRATTQSMARDLGLSGWVRNLDDGRVEAVFEGSRDAIETMLAWVAEGPAHASVEKLDVRWEPTEGHTSFEVR